MDYRELHIDSRSQYRSGGTVSEPEFRFNDPLFLRKFALKQCQIPLVYYNNYKQQVNFVIHYADDADGTNDTTYNVTVPLGLYDFGGANPGAAALETALNAADPGSPWTVTESADLVHGDDYQKISIVRDTTATPQAFFWLEVKPATIFCKLLGYHPSEVRISTIPAYVDNTVGASGLTPSTKFVDFNYLYLRSDLAQGSHFTPQANTGPNYQIGNVLARVPIPTGQDDTIRGSYVNYENFPIDKDLMFSYNGQYLDKARFWWTYPESDDVVDFRDKNWTASLAIFTSRML